MWSRAASILATLSGNLYLAVGSLVVGSIAILTFWTRPRGRLGFRLARLWARGLLAASGVRLHVEGEGRLEPARPYVFMSNHQSLFDIPALLASVPVECRFMAKRSLFRIPVFGWALASIGFIPVDRGDRRRAGQSFAEAMRRLGAGVSVLLFPEETRSETGELLPFKRGGFLLALKSGLPIVPVGISGTLAVQRKGRLAIRPGRVHVRFGEAISVESLGIRDRQRLNDDVRRSIAELAGVVSGAGSHPATSEQVGERIQE